MPAERARRFGREVRHLRKRAGLSQSELGTLIAVSNKTVSSYETGRSLPDGDRIDRLDKALSAGGSLVQAWEDVTQDHDLPESWRRYQDLEQEAAEIQEFHSHVIPGLLQTKAYAEAIIRNTSRRSDEEITKLVELRSTRLTSLQNARLSFVLDEHAVRNVVGSLDVQVGQVDHLLKLTESRKISFGVIPLRTPHHPNPGWPFRITILQSGRTVAHESYRSGVHTSSGRECRELVSLFGTLQAEALPWRQTLMLLNSIRRELEDEAE